MAPGRDLVATDAETGEATRDYLRACIDLASDAGAGAVCGPFYSATGRVWRMGSGERAAAYHQLREGLGFTADNAAIATAASIWRPLAPTQDDLARDGLAFLRTLTTGADA